VSSFVFSAIILSAIRNVSCIASYLVDFKIDSSSCTYVLEYFPNGTQPSTVQVLLITGYKISDDFGQGFITVALLETCVYCFVSYELSKDFKLYLRNNFDSLSPKNFYFNMIVTHERVSEILNELNQLSSSTTGLMVLYGVVNFSKYAHRMVVYTGSISNEDMMLEGFDCFLFWLSILFAAEANSNVISIL